MPRTMGLVATALVAAIWAVTAQADQWERSFKVAGSPRLQVETDDGGVKVETWDRPEVAVRVRTLGWRIGDQVKVSASQDGDTIQVAVREPRFQLVIGWGVRSIAVDVWMPGQGELDVKSGDGSVSVAPLRGRAQVETGDGSIVLRGLQGSAVLRSGDGSITASELDGSLEATTRDGRVRVEGRFDALRLRSGDGSIVAQARRGSSPAGDWSLRTGDGPLVLRVAQGLDAELDAHTGDGRITLDLPLQVSGRMSESRLRGRLGKGGPLITLRTGDGPILIERAD